MAREMPVGGVVERVPKIYSYVDEEQVSVSCVHRHKSIKERLREKYHKVEYVGPRVSTYGM